MADTTPGTAVSDAEASRAFMVAAQRLDTMYSLSSDYNVLVAELEQPDAEQNVALIEAEMARLTSDIKHKGYGVAVVLAELERLAEKRKSEVKRLTDSAKAFQNHADRLRQYALTCMENLGIERLETGVHTLSIRQNPPSVTVVDAAAVPHEFERTKWIIDVDKRAILEHFKATGEIPAGVDITRSSRLEVR
jgi:phage host-nuclease inhibitor protein Gam